MIRDIDLADSGHKKIEWVKKHMPILNLIEKDFEKNQYFKGKKIAVSVHLEAKTAYLCKVLKSGGAEVFATGSNPLSTQDDIAAALVEDGIIVNAWHGATAEEYTEHLNLTLDGNPDIIIDDGGDLVHLLHTTRTDLGDKILGGSEETTTGVLRLRAREREGQLKFPMISVNDAYCKYLFDNRYGTGQSVWDGITRTTNLIIAGKNVVVAGYGWCGKGVAMRAKGLGANVIITEINSIKAIEAHMDGFKVMTMNEASKIGDIFITVTGCDRIIHGEHFKNMKDGAIICNAGHFDVEICIPELEQLSVEKGELRKNIMGYKLANGNQIALLAEGRLVNLASGDGHPAEIMDMSFGLQALCAKYILDNYMNMTKKVYNVPEEIDNYVANIKLSSLGISIDQLTKAQKEYLEGWGE